MINRSEKPVDSSLPSSTMNPPEWVKDAIFYQIFPDRFAKSSNLIKPTNIESWSSKPTSYGYKGGDLLGVVEKLDYLTDLGINALSLNPIFQSASNHRYHTHDYYQVDPLLGGNKALRKLVDEVHRRDMRIILDGVFNHASRGFFPFSDLLENGVSSPWLDWFIVHDWPLNAYDWPKSPNYECWQGYPALPKLNTENPQVREYIMQVAEYWLEEYDIDGWRLDVPADIKSTGFWEEFRHRVKQINPSAYILGEIWHQDRAWVNQYRFDALMNYSFAGSVIAFAAGNLVSPNLAKYQNYHPYPPIDAPTLGEQLKKNLSYYDWDFACAQYNLMNSHDTPRFMSLARGDKTALKLGTLIQLTYPGAPCIYYGDEIALRGTSEYDEPHKDPDARWAFPWDDRSTWDEEMLAFFKEATRLRKRHQVLRDGLFEVIHAVDNVFVYGRSNEREYLIIVINAGKEAVEISIPPDRFAQGETPPFRARPPKVLFGSGSLNYDGSGSISVSIGSRMGLVLG